VTANVLFNVEVSSDEEDTRRPSKSEGKHRNIRYSSLKRAADDDEAGSSGIANSVNKTTETSQSQSPAQGIVTYNRFACLSQDELIDNGAQTHTVHSPRTNIQSHDIPRKRFARDPDTNTEPEKRSDNTANQTSTRDKKPPPIYLTSKIKNYIQFSKTLKDSIGDNFNLKFLGEQVKIQFYKTKDFIDFKRFAIEMKYNFHTYSLPEEKTVTMTLKGLPNIPNLEIQEELANLGITTNSCTQINREHSLYATYKINLSAKYTLTQLRKIRYLFLT